MKSKYLDIKKLKESFDPQQNDKNSRKQTKPKKSLKTYLGNQNQTQSDFNGQSEDKYMKKLKFPSKKTSRQGLKPQKASPKKYFPSKYEQSSSNNQMYSNEESERKKRSKVSKQGKLITENHHQANFLGQLDSYLNELKRSKLSISENQQAIQNKTLFMNKLNFLNQQKQLQSTLQKTNKWQNKIKKEKTINRNLQKCIIEIQKVLWDRNDKLQMLEQKIRKQSRQKQNLMKKTNQYGKSNLSKTIFFNKDFGNKTQSIPKPSNKNIIFHEKQSPLNGMSKISSRQKQVQVLFDTYSDTQKQSETTFKQKRPRRKTQNPTNLQKILSKTLACKGIKQIQKAKLSKTYNRFQKQELNDI